MVDLRSNKKEIEVENRKHPRLEFHCDAMILGIDGIQKITDISLGGVFIETSILDQVQIGKILLISANFPTEKSAIRLKAKVVRKNNRGIGCQFIDLDDDKKDAIYLCFETFSDTLPAGFDNQND
jgi:hypothetical protein